MIGIYARELLEGVFAEFAKIDGSRKKEFPEIIPVEIARDMSGAGYMFYEKALIVTLNENVWILSMGTVSGNYQAEIYDSDILAIKISSDASNMAAIVRRIKKESYLRNSLIVIRNNGIIHVRENHFCKNVREALGDILSGFIVQDPKVDHERIDVSTLGSFVVEQARYDPKFAKVLSEKLLEILKIS